MWRHLVDKFRKNAKFAKFATNASALQFFKARLYYCPPFQVTAVISLAAAELYFPIFCQPATASEPLFAGNQLPFVGDTFYKADNTTSGILLCLNGVWKCYRIRIENGLLFGR